MENGILPGIGHFLVGFNISMPTAGATPGWCFPEMVGFPVHHHLHHLRLPGRNFGVASTLCLPKAPADASPSPGQERGPPVLFLSCTLCLSLLVLKCEWGETCPRSPDTQLSPAFSVSCCWALRTFLRLDYNQLLWGHN